MKKKKKEADNAPTQVIELNSNDVAIVLRGNGTCETICTLKGKHALTEQEEIVIGLGGLLQLPKFVESIKQYFFTNMQNMLSAKMQNDMSNR